MITIQNLILKVFENFPHLKEKFEYEHDDLTPYNIAGDFAIDFKNEFLESKLNKLEVKRFFDFINLMANSEDIQVINVLQVEIFEILIDDNKTLDLAKDNLNENGKVLLEEVVRFWKGL